MVLSNHISDKTMMNNYSKFKRIPIKDSTCFQIDESLKEIYQGSGGSRPEASTRIQFEYDILTGTITALKITSFRIQDSEYAKPNKVHYDSELAKSTAF